MKSPEIAQRIVTPSHVNNVHDVGHGDCVILIHGSGPGVSAWANWRLVMPSLAEHYRVIAPDMAGFGYTERQQNTEYSAQLWTNQLVEIMDALKIDKAHFVGNSFGGSMALAMAIHHPTRLNKMVLMGSVGLNFPISAGLDAVWGYTPSIENMRKLLDLFAYDRSIVNDELAKLRYEASIQPGFQESFAQMFPAPRQRWVEAMAHKEADIARISQPTLIIHGRDDQVIPLENSLRLHHLIANSELHVFGQCGHWTQIEKSQKFNELLVDFFKM